MARQHESDSPEITPQVIHLVDLLKWAKEGRLRVPIFQRDFVWKRQDIIDLFDSVANQYPIGTLFLWGAEPMPASRDHIGPLKVPDYKSQTWLVLDGQQRLTTLVGVLLREDEAWSEGEEPEPKDPGRWSLYYDAEERGFVHGPLTPPTPESYIPVPALMGTMKLFNEVQRMMQSETAERAKVEEWVNRAQEVARAIQGYRVPIVQFTTNDLSVAVESFSRLNKKGRSIGPDEMFSALTYQEGEDQSFHLAAEIDKLQHTMIRSGFGEVNRTILLRAVLTAADLDMYRTDWSRLGEQVKGTTLQKLPTAVEEAARGFEAARAFLKNLGILNTRMLPYSMQLVALGAFFGRCPEPTVEQQTLLKRWFWSSSFAGWFGTGNPSRVRRLVKELQDQVSKQPHPTSLENMDLDQEALPTPSRFDLRSARVRVLVCLLLRQRPRRLDGSEMTLDEGAALLLERGPGAMSTVCATVEDPGLRISPANRILDVAPDIRGQAKAWLLDLDPVHRDAILTSHAIAPEAFELLSNGQHNEFLRLRMEQLGDIERDFMQEVGVTPPKSQEAQPSPIDTDDEDIVDFSLISP